MTPVRSADLFCRVIDNFGDAGVCWRLARALARAGLVVRLWVDDLPRLQRLRPRLDVSLPAQPLDGFTVIRWDESAADATSPAYVPGDLVIEAFACRMPDAMLVALAATAPRSAWINLEYLTAEHWARDSHGLPSPHPRWPLTQYFYFPGVEEGSGGLIEEPGLREARAAFGTAERDAWLASLGLIVPADTLLMSLFCYPHAPVDALFGAMQRGPRVLCVVPEGVAVDAVKRLTGGHAVPGTQVTLGQLTLRVIPFLEPDDYDRLLWCGDLNFVRGEDSLVRAHWAEQPFVWQLYPQQERAHLAKMEAFLQVFLRDATADDGSTGVVQLPPSVAAFWAAWNEADAGAVAAHWPGLCQALPPLRAQVRGWVAKVHAVGELSGKIVEFANKIR